MSLTQSELDELVVLAKLGGEVSLDGMDAYEAVKVFSALRDGGVLAYIHPVSNHEHVIHYMCLIDNLTITQDGAVYKTKERQEATILLGEPLDSPPEER